jgi:nitrite reductase (NADH) large subunit
MKIVVVGHGMVGHKFLETLDEAGVRACRSHRAVRGAAPAYDRVHLSEFFAGRTAATCRWCPRASSTATTCC